MRLGTAVAAAALAACAAAASARAADTIALTAPADGSSWSARTTMRFAWAPVLASPLGEALLVATDPRFANLVVVHSWSCDAGCATEDAVAALRPGTYYWGVGAKLGSGAAVLSDPWRFTVRAPLRPPTRHRKHPKRR